MKGQTGAGCSAGHENSLRSIYSSSMGSLSYVENRKQIIKKCNNQCAICKCNKSENKFEIDHIKPLSAGGTNHISKLQLLCKACHKQKSKHEQ